MEMFVDKFDTPIDFKTLDGPLGMDIVQISVPDATAVCSQKVLIIVEEDGEEVGQDFFIIEIKKKGFF